MGNACGGGGGGCFVAGTMISTPDGMQPIETLQKGDIVLARNALGVVTEQPVTRTYRTLARSFLEINGSIRVTDDHPFLMAGTWTDAGKLGVGDRLKSSRGGSVDVVSVRTVNRGARVYNIEVANDHTFFADGILVHNKQTPHQD